MKEHILHRVDTKMRQTLSDTGTNALERRNGQLVESLLQLPGNAYFKLFKPAVNPFSEISAVTA